MKKTLKQKIATGIVLAGVGLGSLINTGCGTAPDGTPSLTPNSAWEELRKEAEFYQTPEGKLVQEQEKRKEKKFWNGVENVFWGGMASGAFNSPENTPQQNAILGGVGQAGLHNSRNQAIRDSGTNVNVIIPLQNESGVVLRTLFTCNYYKDFDRDGLMGYPEEYVGIKNKFKKDEKIILVVGPYGKTNIDWILEIYNPKGEKIMQYSDTFTHPAMTQSIGNNEDDLMPALLERGGLGTYKVSAYVNNKMVGLHEFEVIE